MLNLKNILIVIGLFIALAVISSMGDYDAEQEEQDQYCEMVRMNMRDKNTGWPDFNENYKEVCEKEQK